MARDGSESSDGILRASLADRLLDWPGVGQAGARARSHGVNVQTCGVPWSGAGGPASHRDGHSLRDALAGSHPSHDSDD
jgi:hypothetical protein